MSQQISIQQIDSGFIVRGYTYPYRETLKASGATWDAANLWWHLPGKELPSEIVALVVGTDKPSKPSKPAKATKSAPKPLRPLPPQGESPLRNPQFAAPTATPPAKPDARIAKWRKSANALQKQIDRLHRPFGDQNLTHRRQRLFDSRIKEGDRLIKHQHALRAIADALERGELPAILAKLTRTETLLELADGYSWSAPLVFDYQFTDVLRLPLNAEDQAFVNSFHASCKAKHASNVTLSHALGDTRVWRHLHRYILPQKFNNFKHYTERAGIVMKINRGLTLI